MAYLTYSEKLKDPRWQKKRLSILNRDNFTCQLCADKETTLHIHHFCYNTNYNPWDIEDTSLITYCEPCHALVEYNKGCSDMIFGVLKFSITGVGIVLHSYVLKGIDYAVMIGIFKKNSIGGKGYYELLGLKKETIESMVSYIQHPEKLPNNAKQNA